MDDVIHSLLIRINQLFICASVFTETTDKKDLSIPLLPKDIFFTVTSVHLIFVVLKFP